MSTENYSRDNMVACARCGHRYHYDTFACPECGNDDGKAAILGQPQMTKKIPDIKQGTTSLDGSCFDCTPEARNKAIAEAQAKGYEVVLGTPHTLLLDLDGSRKLNEAMLTKLEELFGDCTREQWSSKDGFGKHVVLTFPAHAFSEGEALALEQALGSDALRAVLGVRRVQYGIEQVRVLFKPTEASKAWEDAHAPDDDLFGFPPEDEV